MKLRTPLIYYGGKTMLADFVISNLPPHKRYIDVFGGGAAVQIRKAPSEVEVYNDIGFVYEFFRCLRSDDGAELIRRLQNTPWSSLEFDNCRLTWEGESDPIEKVRKWVVRINQGFTHEQDCDQWLISQAVNSASAHANRMYLLPLIRERFMRVILEHKSFEHIIGQYDHKDALFYCDPPYPQESRKEGGGEYENEMSLEQHELLLDMLNKIDGQAVVSGYSHPLYHEKLKDWRVVSKTRRGQIHNGAQSYTMRTEYLYIREHTQYGLWNTTQQKERSDVAELYQQEFA